MTITIGELYKKVLADESLKARFMHAAKAGRVEEFLREHGCGATKDEVVAFLKEKAKEDAPLSASELENTSGGACNDKTTGETIVSVVGMGAGCGIYALFSIGFGHVGQKNENEGRLCTFDDDYNDLGEQ